MEIKEIAARPQLELDSTKERLMGERLETRAKPRKPLAAKPLARLGVMGRVWI